MKMMKGCLWMPIVLLGFVVLCAAVGYCTMEKSTVEGGISMPLSSIEVFNERVSTVQMILEDAGFTNISFEPAPEGLSMDEGKVYRVQVGDSTSFSSGESFPPDISIIIIYK